MLYASYYIYIILYIHNVCMHVFILFMFIYIYMYMYMYMYTIVYVYVYNSAQIIARTAEATRQVAGISEVSP